VHIHVSEQTAEVEECVQTRGARPVQWLLANASVNGRWTLVHATHLDKDEVTGIARSGAVVALCPTTEANLGDGLFPLREYIGHGGRFGIGSDSNVSVSPVEELRWLEYGQRLAARQRNIAATVEHPRSGESVLLRSVAGGRQALAQDGQEQDWLTLDDCAPALAGVAEDDVHDRFVFAGNIPLVRDVTSAASASCTAAGTRAATRSPRVTGAPCARCSPTAEHGTRVRSLPRPRR
jgi:formimidoylglutamate deiminase